MRPAASLVPIFVFACLCLGAGCNLDNEGDAPPRANIYFPAAVALSSSTGTNAPRFLYVVNSNFDLRYNAGSLQAYDLNALDAKIAKACGDTPGIECEIESGDVMVDEVLISSFATGIASDPDFTRLYVPTRTDSSLLYVDIDESGNGKDKRVFDCGAATGRGCDDDHRRGDDSVQSERRLRLPAEPVGVISGRAADLSEPGETPISGSFVLIAHRGGQVSLFLDEAEGSAPVVGGTKNGPLLTDVLADLAPEPSGLAFDPITRRAYLSVFDRAGTSLPTKLLGRVGVSVDPLRPQNSFLYDAGSLNIDGVGLSRDTRALAFQSGSGEALVLSRQPSALLWVDVASAPGDYEPTEAVARRTVDVGAGPSRLALGELDGRAVVVVSCFDARQIYVLDAVTGALLSIVHNLSGPFEIALDSLRMRLYVADFRSSVVRVIDLSPIVASMQPDTTSARVIATIGSPKLIQELQ